jgi:hypothetical protein
MNIRAETILLESGSQDSEYQYWLIIPVSQKKKKKNWLIDD